MKWRNPEKRKPKLNNGVSEPVLVALRYITGDKETRKTIGIKHNMGIFTEKEGWIVMGTYMGAWKVVRWSNFNKYIPKPKKK